MSDPIIPKVKKHVVEGDYTDVKAQQTEQTQQNASQSQNSAKETEGSAPSLFKVWQLVVAGGSVLFLVILYLLYQQGQAQDRLVEAVNQLQTQTSALTESLQTQAVQQENLQKELLNMKKQLIALQAKVAQLESPERQPVVSQADIEAMQQQIAQLKQQMQQLGETASQLASKGVNTVQEGVQQVLKDPEVQQKLNTVQQKMQQLGERLKRLLEQQDEEAAQQPDLPKLPNALVVLTPVEIQQWAVKINTQWQLTGNIAETKAQLQALEQAIAASELPNKLALMKAIGQDYAMLDQWQKTEQRQALPSVAPLKAWLQQLAQAKPVSKAVEESSKKSQNSQSRMGAEAVQSAQDRLMAKFSSLFSIHKRQDVAQLTGTEKVLFREVLIQRGLLLVDQLDWAVQTHHIEGVASSVRQLEAFVAQYFPEHQAELAKLIAPFKALQFKPRPNLHIVEAL